MAWMVWRLFLRRKQADKLAPGGALALQAQRNLRALCYLFNLHTLVLMAAACAAVYGCHALGWSFNMEYGVVAMGTVFPLTFTLAQAFTRRDRATLLIANLKASLVGLYLMHRDWQQAGYTNGQLGNDRQPQAVTSKAVLMDLAINIRRYLVARTPFESLAEARLTAGQDPYLRLFQGALRLSDRNKRFREAVRQMAQSDPAETLYREIYKQLSRLNVLNEKLTLTAGYTRGGEGGMSRTNQYMRFIIANVEELRTIKLYRTPAMMRHAVAVLIHIFTVLLAPYWTHFCAPAGPHVAAGECAAGYASAVAFMLVVLLLFHVQQDLEECLTETGLDDVFFVPEELDAHLIGGDQVLRSARSSASDLTHMVAQDAHLFAGYGRLSFQDLTGAFNPQRPGGGSPGALSTGAPDSRRLRPALPASAHPLDHEVNPLMALAQARSNSNSHLSLDMSRLPLPPTTLGLLLPQGPARTFAPPPLHGGSLAAHLRPHAAATSSMVRGGSSGRVSSVGGSVAATPRGNSPISPRPGGAGALVTATTSVPGGPLGGGGEGAPHPPAWFKRSGTPVPVVPEEGVAPGWGGGEEGGALAGSAVGEWVAGVSGGLRGASSSYAPSPAGSSPTSAGPAGGGSGALLRGLPPVAVAAVGGAKGGQEG